MKYKYKVFNDKDDYYKVKFSFEGKNYSYMYRKSDLTGDYKKDCSIIGQELKERFMELFMANLILERV